MLAIAGSCNGKWLLCIEEAGETLKQVEVVFCGNSLYLCGLAASLQQKEQFRICWMEYEPMNALPELKMLCPDVLVMEAANYNAKMASSLRKKSDPVIIVVYPETDSLEVFWENRRYTTAIDSLISVITDVTAGNQA
ncbi:MAG: hypothetical protein H6Q72_2456 [Firmicutes bacterium]|nr:hypothetical protein [Bacillota bacterium]